MITLTTSTLFEHQQPHLILLRQDASLYGLHLIMRNMVYIQSHGGAQSFRTLQTSILVRQTRIHHLNQLILQLLLARTNTLQIALLATTITQRQIVLFFQDGAQHLRPILHINHKYTHLQSPSFNLNKSLTTLRAIILACRINSPGNSLMRHFSILNTKYQKSSAPNESDALSTR